MGSLEDTGGAEIPPEARNGKRRLTQAPSWTELDLVAAEPQPVAAAT